MTVLTGEAAAHAQEMTDEAVVDMCMAILRKLFPFKVIHGPLYFRGNPREKLREIWTKGNGYVIYPKAAKEKTSAELNTDFRVLCFVSSMKILCNRKSNHGYNFSILLKIRPLRPLSVINFSCFVENSIQSFITQFTVFVVVVVVLFLFFCNGCHLDSRSTSLLGDALG